jgi:xanthine dehydrogenase YagS FAD-binding subunit
MNVALAALNATVHVIGHKGKRTIPFAEFHRLPGNTPQLDTNLQPDELITAVELPAPKFTRHSYYLKVRDRKSYAFALVSVAAGLEISGNTIQSAGLALGGVAHKPWRSLEAERFLVGAIASPDAFKKAADFALAGAQPQEHNAFKIELAKQGVVRALTLAAQGVQA